MGFLGLVSPVEGVWGGVWWLSATIVSFQYFIIIINNILFEKKYKHFKILKNLSFQSNLQMR